MTKENFFKYIKCKTVTFCGIARSNMPLIELFAQKGAIVSARDMREFDKLGENGEILKNMGINMILGENYLENLTEDIIFRTPGMKYYLPQLVKARENGLVVTSEMELFFDLCPCKIYAITGSDGKTTTTAIISELVKAEGKTVHLGGNIGKPLLPEIEKIAEEDVAVVELSSFQLISMRQSAQVALVTNISPNHLDIHKDMQEYINSKKNVFIHQNAFSRTVLNADNEITREFAGETRGDTLFFSRKKEIARGAYCENGEIFLNGGKILDTADIKIPGEHNVENYLAAICATCGDVSVENIAKVAKNFGGVEHRIELAKRVNGVEYYNDSIASSPTRTISGTLSVFKNKIILISGGYDKKIPYDELGPKICDRAKVLILMGATAEKIKAAVKKAVNYNKDELKIVEVSNMEEAVKTASEIAESGDIVSLSPASASFDMYNDFEQRGRHFKELVEQL